MTHMQRIAYRLFAQAVLLLLLHAAAALLADVKFLPLDPLALSLPFHRIDPLASALLHLAILSGLLGGGLYAACDAFPSINHRSESLFTWASNLWTLLLTLTVLAGLLGLLDVRAGLELPLPLALVEIADIVLVIAGVVTATTFLTPPLLVWMVGMGLVCLGGLLGLFLPADAWTHTLLTALASGLRINIAYPLAGVALLFWLMHRFSNVTPRWAERGVYTCGGLAALAGLLVTMSSAYTLASSPILSFVGSVSMIVVPIMYGIIAAHSYRAFSDRNPTATLAAHWSALAVVLYGLGLGLIGGLLAHEGLHLHAAGTRLIDLQTALTLMGSVALVLAVINQVGAELRGKNRRVTGLMPFWLVAGGVLGGGLALGAAGIVQVYLERVLSFGYLDTQNLLVPLYALWLLGGLATAGGLLTFALGFWARRPAAR
jgi:nitric oxide reductase subunit B